MRRIGILSDGATADRFAEYLRARGLECRRDATANGDEFWLYNEDLIDDVRGELENFREGRTPTIPAPPAPPASRVEPMPERRPSRLPSSPQNYLPWTVFLCVAAVAATLATDFYTKLPVVDLLAITPIGNGRAVNFRDNPFALVAKGEVWRLFTPALMHLNFVHLLFGLQWTWVFGSAIERLRGTWRLVGLTLLSAAISNLGQYWWSGPTFGGLSGVGHAMFGYVWMKYRFQPELRFVIPSQLMWMFWIWFVLCFTGLVGPIANGAHAVGLAVGILYGMVPFL